MEIRHIKYFQAVASTSNLSLAAKKLNISQSSVTRAIQELEQEAGCPLIIRNSSGVELTAAGERFLVHTIRAISALNSAFQDIHEIITFPDPINIGFCPGVLIFDFIESLRSDKFNTESLRFFEFTFHDQISRLQNEKIDLALVRATDNFIGDSQFKNYSSIPLIDLKLFAVLPVTHRFSWKKSLSLVDLSEENFITLDNSQYPCSRKLFTERCQDAGFTPRITFEANGYLSALATISGGSCIGLFPKSIVGTFIPSIVYVPLDNKNCTTKVSCIYRKNEHRENILSLICRINLLYNNHTKL